MISLVIPCFNETEVLELTYQTLAREAQHWDEPIEMVLVDDGSRDDTWAIIQALAQRDPRVRGVRLSRNFGHQAAIGAGLEQARGKAVVVLDADLQDPPHLIGSMIARWREGYQVVAARRNCREGESTFKKVIGYVFYRMLACVTNVQIPTDTGDFALLDRSVVAVLLRCPERAMFWRGLRCFAGFRHTFVTFDRPARAGGESKYTLAKMVQLASNGLLANSEHPLRLGLYLGGASLLGTLLLAVLSLLCVVLGVNAGSSLSTLGVFFLGSVQLVCLGVIGEYLNRIYSEVRNRPRWVIAEQAEAAAPAQAGHRAA